MKIQTLIVPLSFVLMAGSALAETVVVDDQVVVRASDIARPAPGMKMDVVEKRFGEPTERHAAVGAPPISRWDYAGYSVFFEKDRVIHTVVIGS
jgi:hypothetical protein